MEKSLNRKFKDKEIKDSLILKTIKIISTYQLHPPYYIDTVSAIAMYLFFFDCSILNDQHFFINEIRYYTDITRKEIDFLAVMPFLIGQLIFALAIFSFWTFLTFVEEKQIKKSKKAFVQLLGLLIEIYPFTISILTIDNLRGLKNCNFIQKMVILGSCILSILISWISLFYTKSSIFETRIFAQISKIKFLIVYSLFLVLKILSNFGSVLFGAKNLSIKILLLCIINYYVITSHFFWNKRAEKNFKYYLVILIMLSISTQLFEIFSDKRKYSFVLIILILAVRLVQNLIKPKAYNFLNPKLSIEKTILGLLDFEELNSSFKKKKNEKTREIEYLGFIKSHKKSCNIIDCFCNSQVNKSFYKNYVVKVLKYRQKSCKKNKLLLYLTKFQLLNYHTYINQIFTNFEICQRLKFASNVTVLNLKIILERLLKDFEFERSTKINSYSNIKKRLRNNIYKKSKLPLASILDFKNKYFCLIKRIKNVIEKKRKLIGLLYIKKEIKFSKIYKENLSIWNAEKEVENFSHLLEQKKIIPTYYYAAMISYHHSVRSDLQKAQSYIKRYIFKLNRIQREIIFNRKEIIPKNLLTRSMILECSLEEKNYGQILSTTPDYNTYLGKGKILNLDINCLFPSKISMLHKNVMGKTEKFPNIFNKQDNFYIIGLDDSLRSTRFLLKYNTSIKLTLSSMICLRFSEPYSRVQIMFDDQLNVISVSNGTKKFFEKLSVQNFPINLSEISKNLYKDILEFNKPHSKISQTKIERKKYLMEIFSLENEEPPKINFKIKLEVINFLNKDKFFHLEFLIDRKTWHLIEELYEDSDSSSSASYTITNSQDSDEESKSSENLGSLANEFKESKIEIKKSKITKNKFSKNSDQIFSPYIGLYNKNKLQFNNEKLPKVSVENYLINENRNPLKIVPYVKKFAKRRKKTNRVSKSRIVLGNKAKDLHELQSQKSKSYLCLNDTQKQNLIKNGGSNKDSKQIFEPMDTKNKQTIAKTEKRKIQKENEKELEKTNNLILSKKSVFKKNQKQEISSKKIKVIQKSKISKAELSKKGFESNNIALATSGLAKSIIDALLTKKDREISKEGSSTYLNKIQMREGIKLLNLAINKRKKSKIEICTLSIMVGLIIFLIFSLLTTSEFFRTFIKQEFILLKKAQNLCEIDQNARSLIVTLLEFAFYDFVNPLVNYTELLGIKPNLDPNNPSVPALDSLDALSRNYTQNILVNFREYKLSSADIEEFGQHQAMYSARQKVRTRKGLKINTHKCSVFHLLTELKNIVIRYKKYHETRFQVPFITEYGYSPYMKLTEYIFSNMPNAFLPGIEELISFHIAEILTTRVYSFKRKTIFGTMIFFGITLISFFLLGVGIWLINTNYYESFQVYKMLKMKELDFMISLGKKHQWIFEELIFNEEELIRSSAENTISREDLKGDGTLQAKIRHSQVCRKIKKNEPLPSIRCLKRAGFIIFAFSLASVGLVFFCYSFKRNLGKLEEFSLDFYTKNIKRESYYLSSVFYNVYVDRYNVSNHLPEENFFKGSFESFADHINLSEKEGKEIFGNLYYRYEELLKENPCEGTQNRDRFTYKICNDLNKGVYKSGMIVGFYHEFSYIKSMYEYYLKFGKRPINSFGINLNSALEYFGTREFTELRFSHIAMNNLFSEKLYKIIADKKKEFLGTFNDVFEMYFWGYLICFVLFLVYTIPVYRSKRNQDDLLARQCFKNIHPRVIMENPLLLYRVKLVFGRSFFKRI